MNNKEFTFEGKILALRERQKEWKEKVKSKYINFSSSCSNTNKIITYVSNDEAKKISKSHWLCGLL